jgi:hypothetical protein
MVSGDGKRLDKVFEVQEMIADLHPCLQQLYPIAIADGNELIVYDIPLNSRCYQMATRIELPTKLPTRLRAAFPIEGYGNKPACVVTEDVFENLDGYITIFHEFVHCYQFAVCEQELKQSLGIARDAQASGDYMWELNYPFPYGKKGFQDRYLTMLTTLRQNPTAVNSCRADLKESLSNSDFEYMVWQEWKEGFARFIENKIQHHLGLPQNLGGSQLPFRRTVFYTGGAKLIDFITRSEPPIANDLRVLFREINGDQP